MNLRMLHGNWSDGTLCLWAESLPSYRSGPPASAAVAEPGRPSTDAGAATATLVETEVTTPHWFAEPPAAIAEALAQLLPNGAAIGHGSGRITLQLPGDNSGPHMSDRLAAAVGGLDDAAAAMLGRYDVPCLVVEAARGLEVLVALDALEPEGDVEIGHGLQYWIAVGRFAIELLIGQRFVPSLVQESIDGGLHARWQPWLHDRATRERVGALITAMPPACRATVDRHAGTPWPILDEALRTMIDRSVRTALVAEDYGDAIADRDPTGDAHVAVLGGLVGHDATVVAKGDESVDLLRDLGRWMGRLDDTGGHALKLALRIGEPAGSDLLPDLEPPSDAMTWPLTFHLQSEEDPDLVLDAESIWGGTGAAPRVAGLHMGRPDEVLITELERASRLYPRLESVLTEAAPTSVDLTTAEAYELLSEYRPLLAESGVHVEAPAWWDHPMSRLGARLHIDSDPSPAADRTPNSGPGVAPHLGLQSVVRFQWQMAVGDTALSVEEFQRLAAQAAPMTRVQGRWVVMRPEVLEEAAKFLAEHPGGEATLQEAMRLAHGVESRRSAFQVLGVDATGWVGDLLTASDDNVLENVKQPSRLLGELRPYQLSGLSWLAFVDRLGLGACLADDMGLGKTVQLIALLQLERERAPDATFGPTLLLVPTSLIGNWTREINRFAPELTIHVQHGPERPVGDEFLADGALKDVVITTYGLVSRDLETLQRLTWHRIVLDEAQYIKNPPTKQTQAIRSLNTPRRVALTGTPVENRLSELWSILEFCNPGYLGAPAEFRRRFAVPIERHRDSSRAAVLRQLVRPFVLRRVKTDPDVISDLPPCVQTREYATLTTEQAAAYQRVVDQMLSRVDTAEGIQRRGLVLSTLVRLKQVCNHPVLVAGEDAPPPDDASLSARSGKARRLIRMLEELVAAGDRALIFTQFRQMGHLLTAMIEHELDCKTLFLHGGTTQIKRQQMIDRFQDEDGDVPIFVLSLKAGGVGLNLTAANHVFHYDRWWNPAVENQATDRAFRIGQNRTVHVHKFVCLGTLEERIDQMIEQKTELAANIIGTGEQWLTELSTSQLRDVLTLRHDALEVEG